MAEIRLEGRLARQAQHRVGPNGSAWLWLDIAQGGNRLPAHARWRMGEGESAQHACARAARRMAAGTLVRVKALGWSLDKRERQLVLEDVKDVTQLDIPAPVGAQPEKEAA